MEILHRAAPCRNVPVTFTLDGMEPTELERAVLAWFARRADSPELAEQCSSAEVLAREYTGAGYFVQLSSRSPAANPEIGCVPNSPLVSSPRLPYGASVDLWLREGSLDHLEIVALGGADFPDTPFAFELTDSQ